MSNTLTKTDYSVSAVEVKDKHIEVEQGETRTFTAYAKSGQLLVVPAQSLRTAEAKLEKRATTMADLRCPTCHSPKLTCSFQSAEDGGLQVTVHALEVGTFDVVIALGVQIYDVRIHCVRKFHESTNLALSTISNDPLPSAAYKFNILQKNESFFMVGERTVFLLKPRNAQTLSALKHGHAHSIVALVSSPKGLIGPFIARNHESEFLLISFVLEEMGEHTVYFACTDKVR